jgi:preprotein translocase subunit YajC
LQIVLNYLKRIFMQSVRTALSNRISYLVSRISLDFLFASRDTLHASQLIRTGQSKCSRLVSFVASIIFVSPAAWAQEGGSKPGGGGLGLFAPMILVFLIFYFLLIRPQSKQQKRHQELLKTVERGDEVVTSAGIHGKVTSVTEQTVSLEIADNVRIRLDKKQIAQVKNKPAEPPKKS